MKQLENMRKKILFVIKDSKDVKDRFTRVKEIWHNYLPEQRNNLIVKRNKSHSAAFSL